MTVFERPGLREFLKQLSEFANLVLFTAGLEGLLNKMQFPYFLCFILFFVLIPLFTFWDLSGCQHGGVF